MIQRIELTKRFKNIDPLSITDYLKTDGYKMLKKALEMNADVLLISQTVTQKDVHIKNLVNLVELLEKNLEKEEVNRVLAGNNHGIPEKSLLPEKIEYENYPTLKDYLEARHERKVKELEEFYTKDKVWFEQIITQEVIDFVKSNQEILSARLEDDLLYITKIPYDAVSYLDSSEDLMKKYFACHCPFAREAIKEGRKDLSKRFCYCSAGFAKYPFEVILGQDLEVKVIETVLGEGKLCKFVIDLKNINYKR